MTAAVLAANSRDLARATRGAARRGRTGALLMVLPLASLLVATFAVPVGWLLTRSIYDPAVAAVLPGTVEALRDWSASDGAPDEPAFAALAVDLRRAREQNTLGPAAARINQEYPGARSLLQNTARQLSAARAPGPPWREAATTASAKWSDPAIWAAIQRTGRTWTAGYLLAALDLTGDESGGVVRKPEDQRIHVRLFLRTLLISGAISLFCLLLAYPVAYLLARLPPGRANLLMLFVLLPFWSSILVRITAWIALLQTRGVLNDALVALRVIGDANRPALMYNSVGVVVVATHVLLPFCILPLYSVMKGINPAFLRAAQMLGAGPATAFLRVYLPLSMPGILAGTSLVFVLAVGYFITPALVGGQTGQLIGNVVAYHMQQSLNWGLAAALSTVLLALVGLLYAVYVRLLRVRR